MEELTVQSGRKDLKILNRDVIKYIAMFTMLLNHIAAVFLERGTVLHEILEDVGYFTAITMCYFLVEGYGYTRSKKKYGRRLLLFAIISQFPFMFAFKEAFSVVGLNMIYTLFICFLILVAMEKIQNGILRTIVLILLVFMTVISDWQILAAVFTIMFASYKDSKKKMMMAYGIAFLMFAGLNSLNYVAMNTCSVGMALLHGALSGAAILVSGIVILFFYNGKRSEHGRKFSQWFFYLFYPAHLLVIGLVHYFM